MNIFLNKIKFLDSSTLKLIAILTMLVDHIGAVLFPQVFFLRVIGRISFPIFCFLLVEGFVHTSNTTKYAIRLGIFALISEIPFDLVFFKKFIYIEHQNVFFTLLLGLIALILISKFENKPLPTFIIFLLTAFTATLLKSDYSSAGIFLIVFLYFFYNHPIKQTFIYIIFCCVLFDIRLYYLALVNIPLICCYNGKRGINLKYIFYLFYPIHLIILYFISSLILF